MGGRRRSASHEQPLRSTRTYRMPNGEALELRTEPTPMPVAEVLDASKVREAIREAQARVLLTCVSIYFLCCRTAR